MKKLLRTLIFEWSGIIAMAAVIVYVVATATGCVSDVGPDGVKHTTVAGVFDVSKELPAPPGLLESTPWGDPMWAFFTPDARLVKWAEWNAEHDYTPAEKPAGPVGDTSGIGGWLATGYAVWLAIRGASKTGQSNIAVVKSKHTSWKGTVLAALNLLTGLASSPPEAVQARVASDEAVAKAVVPQTPLIAP